MKTTNARHELQLELTNYVTNFLLRTETVRAAPKLRCSHHGCTSGWKVPPTPGHRRLCAPTLSAEYQLRQLTDLKSATDTINALFN